MPSITQVSHQAEIVAAKRNSFQLEVCGLDATGTEMWVLLRAVLERDVAADLTGNRSDSV